MKITINQSIYHSLSYSLSSYSLSSSFFILHIIYPNIPDSSSFLFFFIKEVYLYIYLFIYLYINLSIYISIYILIYRHHSLSSFIIIIHYPIHYPIHSSYCIYPNIPDSSSLSFFPLLLH